MHNLEANLCSSNKNDLFEMVKTLYFENHNPGEFKYEIINDGLKIVKNKKTKYYIIFNSYIK